MSRVVTTAEAVRYAQQMTLPDLVFMTGENEERVHKFLGEPQFCEACGDKAIGPHDCHAISGDHDAE